MNIPDIRFKNYFSSWEQHKFKEITFPAGRKNKDNLPYDSFSITNENGFVPQDEKFENGGTMKDADKSLYSIVDPDSFAYNPARINVGSIGYQNLNKPVIVSSLYEVFKTVSNIDNNFLWHWFKSADFQKLIERLQEGGVRLYFYYDKLCQGEVAIPSFEEQKNIGKLFNVIDSSITLYQHKLDTLKNYKKAMLAKMFPREGQKVPEIRFNGFNMPWENHSFKKHVDISTEMVNPTTGEYDDMPHIAPGNIESFTGHILDNVKTVKEEKLISGKFRFRPGDVVYGKINPQLGKYFFARADGLTSADAYVLKGKNGVNQEFLYALLQTKDFYDYSVSVSMRSGMPKINREELNEYSFLAPSEEEQKKIGTLLLGIDKQITLQQREISKLKDLKQAMLNKMFVKGGN